MPFEQIISHRNEKFTEPTISIGKTNFYFNKACAAVANLPAMKAVDLSWDESNRVLKFKILHVRAENSFLILKPNLATWMIGCRKFIQRIKPKTANGPLYIPARWDEKEKAFVAVIGKTK